MTMPSTVSQMLLTRFDAFDGLEGPELDQLAEAVERCTFEPGDALIVEGENDRELYGVLEGRVEILKTDQSGDERQLAVLESDVILGEHGFILNEPRTATVRALDEVDTLCLRGESFDRLDTDDSRIGRVIEHNILRMLADRQTEINRELLEVLDETEGESGYHCDEENDIGDQLMRRWTV